MHITNEIKLATLKLQAKQLYEYIMDDYGADCGISLLNHIIKKINVIRNRA